MLRRTAKAGLGAAYRAGFEWGLAEGHDVLLEMDADLSHDPSDVPRLLEAVADGAVAGGRVSLRAGRQHAELAVSLGG